MENEMKIAPIQKLNDISNSLLPWWSDFNSDILKLQTEDDPESYLNGFYMYQFMSFALILTVKIFQNSLISDFRLCIQRQAVQIFL